MLTTVGSRDGVMLAGLGSVHFLVGCNKEGGEGETKRE